MYHAQYSVVFQLAYVSTCKFQGGGADNIESICELEGKELC